MAESQRLVFGAGCGFSLPRSNLKSLRYVGLPGGDFPEEQYIAQPAATCWGLTARPLARGLFLAPCPTGSAVAKPSADWDPLLRLRISPEDLRQMGRDHLQGRGGEREGKDGETLFRGLGARVPVWRSRFSIAEGQQQDQISWRPWSCLCQHGRFQRQRTVITNKYSHPPNWQLVMWGRRLFQA